MSHSYVNTIILPSLPQKLLLGLDTIALTPSPRFLGIKGIPGGWHFLYAGADSALSTRTGYWIYVPDTDPSTDLWPRVFKWNSGNEVLEPSDTSEESAYWRKRLLDLGDQELAIGLISYDIHHSQDVQAAAGNSRLAIPEGVDMQPLTSQVSPILLGHMTGTPSPDQNDVYIFSTSSSSPEDRDDIPGLSHAERKFTTGPVGAILGEERELSFIGIDLKRTWREGAQGRERTVDAQDRSGALERIIESAESWCSQSATGEQPPDEEWGGVLLGEMQVTFLMVLLVANWSCLEEWKRILALVLTCKRSVSQRPAFFSEFLQVLRFQLQRCDDIEGGLFDVSGESAGFLKQHLRNFRSTVRDLDSLADGQDPSQLEELGAEMQELEDWVQQEWDWALDGKKILKKGIVQLEDGEDVEIQLDDFDADDESGEYAPVVVDLG